MNAVLKLVPDGGPRVDARRYVNLAELARRVCAAPISFMALGEPGRLTGVASLGSVNIAPVARSCSDLVSRTGQLLMVPDLLSDARFRASTERAGHLPVRSFAGAPIILESGRTAGVLAVLDIAAREIDEPTLDCLRLLASLAAVEVALKSVRCSFDPAPAGNQRPACSCPEQPAGRCPREAARLRAL
jgi:GAF domain-containing protein